MKQRKAEAPEVKVEYAKSGKVIMREVKKRTPYLQGETIWKKVIEPKRVKREPSPTYEPRRSEYSPENKRKQEDEKTRTRESTTMDHIKPEDTNLQAKSLNTMQKSNQLPSITMRATQNNSRSTALIFNKPASSQLTRSTQDTQNKVSPVLMQSSAVQNEGQRSQPANANNSILRTSKNFMRNRVYEIPRPIGATEPQNETYLVDSTDPSSTSFEAIMTG